MIYSIYMGFRENYIRKGAQAACRYAKNLGFNGIEILDGVSDSGSMIKGNFDAAILRESAMEQGMKFTCYSVGGADLYSNADVSMSSLCRHAEIAAKLGSPYLHHTLYPYLVKGKDMPSYTEVLSVVIENALKVSNYANKLGITCIYEPQGLYFNGIDGYGTFLYEMQKHGVKVGVCYDFGNTWFANERPIDFLAEFSDSICNVHIKDYQKTDKNKSEGAVTYSTYNGFYLKDTEFGKGDCEFENSIKILRSIGYDYALAYEGERYNFEKGVNVDLPYVKNLMEK